MTAPHDFREILDRAEFQVDALRQHGDVLLNAGAGSGKTYQLVHKYLYELLRIESERPGAGESGVERLLAITFTERAAQEMKQRVRERLRGLIREHPALSEPLGELHRRLESAYISTIHAFCGRLIREHAGEAGVDPRFSILDEEEASALRREILEGIFIRDLHHESVRLLLSAYGMGDAGRRKGLGRILDDVYGRMRTLGWTPHDLRCIRRRNEARLRGEWDERWKCLQNHVAFFRNRRIPRNAEEFFRQWDALDPDARDFDAASENTLGKLETLCTSVRGNWGKGTVAETRKAIKQTLEELLGILRERGTGPLFNALLTLLERFHALYAERKAESSLLDFSDLEEGALRLLESSGSSAPDRIKTFDAILVDEFQDTNPLQYRILMCLARHGKTTRLFVVGDWKQSIYGFRGADLALFQGFAEEGGASGRHVYPLPTCRRSTSILIEGFYNPFFSRFMQPGDPGDPGDPKESPLFGEEDRMEPVRTVPAREPELIRFEGDRLAAEQRRIEAETLARRIRLLVEDPDAFRPVRVYDSDATPRPPRWSDITVLFRTIKRAEPYVEAFRAHNIPHYLVRGRGYFHCQEVQDLANVLRVLNYNRDEVALAGVLRSPLVGIRDDTLFRLRNTDPEPTPLYRYFEDSSLSFPPGAARDDLRKLAAFREWFARINRLKDRLLISEIIEWILRESHLDSVLLGLFQGRQKLANLHKLIETARRYERVRARTIRDFVFFLDRMFETESREPEADVYPEHENVVRIMNIHQSKGLQFPIVILADIYYVTPMGERDRVFLSESHGLVMEPYNPLRDRFEKGRFLEAARETAKQREREELKRLFYVAATRARDHLILSGFRGDDASRHRLWNHGLALFRRDTCLDIYPWDKVPEPEKKAPAVTCGPSPEGKPFGEEELPEPVARVWERLSPSRKPAAGSAVYTATDLNTFANCPRSYYFGKFLGVDTEPEIPPPEEEAFPPPGEPESTELTVREWGILAHRILEIVPFQAGAEEVRDTVASILDSLEVLPNRGERRRLEERILQVLELPLFREIKEFDCRREFPFLCRLEDEQGPVFLQGVMDLLAVGPRYAWVVDYKYAAPHDSGPDPYTTQLLAYAAAARTLTGLPVRCAVLYLKTDPPLLRRVDPPPARDTETRLIGICREILKRELATWSHRSKSCLEIWEPREEHCALSGCGYRFVCRVGHRNFFTGEQAATHPEHSL